MLKLTLGEIKKEMAGIYYEKQKNISNSLKNTFFSNVIFFLHFFFIHQQNTEKIRFFLKFLFFLFFFYKVAKLTFKREKNKEKDGNCHLL